MTNEIQVRPEMQQEIDRAVHGQAGAILDRLAERLRGAANAAAVYGTPVVRDGVTVIPVAKVRWGFGGGGGTGTSPGDKGSGSGEGGGGGVLATPMGYIEMRDGSTEFKQITDPMTMLIVPPIIIASGITAMLVLRGLRLLIRR
ncbi:MAG: spore germination protein GerW family protein [Dehalococcoidia bacterium]